MAKCAINVCKIKDLGFLAGLGEHNNRQKIGKLASKYIDNQKSKLNYSLKKCENYVMDLNNKINNACLTRKIRKDAVIAGAFVVNAPTNNNFDLNKQFFIDSFEFIKEMVGEKNIISADVHNDEKTPHLHVVFVPIKNKNGKNFLSWRDFFGQPKDLVGLQTDFFEKVGKNYGLERGEKRELKTIKTREYRANRERVELLKKEEEFNQHLKNDFSESLKKINDYKESNNFNFFSRKKFLKDLENLSVMANALNEKMAWFERRALAAENEADKAFELADSALRAEFQKKFEKEKQVLEQEQEKAKKIFEEAEKIKKDFLAREQNLNLEVRKKVSEQVEKELVFKVGYTKNHNLRLLDENSKLIEKVQTLNEKLEDATSRLDAWRSADIDTLIDWHNQLHHQKTQKRGRGR